MTNFWGKKIKNTKTIAERLNVDEEKISELKDGKRTISGNTFDKVLEMTNKTKTEQELENVEILQWYNNTDLKQLRKDFGYKSQAELARKLKCDNSTICNFENKKDEIKQVGDRLKQLYYFFQNDFNRNIKDENKKIEVKHRNTVLSKEYTDEEKEEILNFLKNEDLKSIRLKENLSMIDLSRKLKVAQSCICNIENKKAKFKYLSNTMEILYNWYKEHKKDDIKEKKEVIKIDENIEPEVEPKNINIENYYNVIDDCEIINTNTQNDSIKEVDFEDNKKIEYEKYIDFLVKENRDILKENADLKIQIKRYEKLIDRL